MPEISPQRQYILAEISATQEKFHEGEQAVMVMRQFGITWNSCKRSRDTIIKVLPLHKKYSASKVHRVFLNIQHNYHASLIVLLIILLISIGK
jgi:hypothetical protein